ncbi:hypothetical protein DH2020_047663 [Rehmannia glutinosa]|uniref:Uncharacterized protein n=1 Tax=Rehmannia glutinosa TaxID=99300 RepID=A0ABR0U7X9_REHGL
MFLSSKSSNPKWRMIPDFTVNISTTTNISHLFFGIAGASNTWSKKKLYVETWWRPNVTRGLVFMDKSPVQNLPWPLSIYPPFRVSEDNSRYREYNKHAMPFVIRVARVIEETFKTDHDGGVIRWYVMADDDTVFFIDNLVEVLSKYDHRKYFYIGMRSESIVSNSLNSFEMAFGGGGYALSYPLAKAVAQNMDLCIKRYPTVFGSDQLLQSCIADLGVSLTQEKGFHQIDFHRDISGFLSAHPQSPLVSLHHFDAVDPIFPSMNRIESVNHLMKAAAVDQSRLLQQTICYYNKNNWTFSVSWGYLVQIYEDIFPPSYLYRPLETFIPWKKGANPPYMFNTRPLPTDPCDAPHFFFFSSVDENRVMNHFVTTYKRGSPRSLPACVSNASRSADHISKIRLLSPLKNRGWQDGDRRECCDVVQLVGMDSLAVKLRDCMNDEIVA